MPTPALRTATDDDFDAIVSFDGRSFGEAWPEAERKAVRPTLQLDRFHVAHDGDALVALGGVYTQELTVPGGGIVAAGGVTWIAVAPTHRRQGLLTTLMDRIHNDIDARSEPVSMLTASEGGIYGRFGYGSASYRRHMELDGRRAEFREEHRPAAGEVALTTHDDVRLVEIFDRYRRERVGEIRRTAEHFALSNVSRGPDVTVAIHADGYAVWKVTGNWNGGHPAFELVVLDMVAITPEAHAALWHSVLAVDLVATIRSEVALAVDDVLPRLLTDQRLVRTTNLNDMMWIHLRDVATSLSARTYGSTDELVIEVDLGDRSERWRISGSPEGADIQKVRRRPDLSMDRAALGAIYLGGVRPSTLVRSGEIRAQTAELVRRADAFFSADRLPHCMTGF